MCVCVWNNDVNNIKTITQSETIRIFHPHNLNLENETSIALHVIYLSTEVDFRIFFFFFKQTILFEFMISIL